MSNTKIYLTYCSENRDLVEHFAVDLGRVGIEFVYDIRDGGRSATLDEQMAGDNAPIFLFVSDNFLKNIDSMEGALKFIDNFKYRPRIKPIVIDGRIKDEVTGVYEDVPTKFDKVSNVIRYMNYWQDEYLRLRREKRTIPYSEEASFQIKIDRIRRISNEIGEFLRSLRGFNYMEFEALKSNDYKQVFDLVGFESGAMYARYKTFPELPFRYSSMIEDMEEQPKMVKEEEQPTIEIEPEVVLPEMEMPTQAPEIKLPVEEVEMPEEEEAEASGEEEIPTFSIGEIPGLEMLPQDEIEEVSNGFLEGSDDDDDDDDEEAVEGGTPSSEEDSGAAPKDNELIQTPAENYSSAEDFVNEIVNPETEVDELESVLSSIAPVTKSVSLLPHTPEGKFQQMPEQGITKEEYEKRVREIKKIDWAGYHGSDGQDEKYCEGDRCTV